MNTQTKNSLLLLLCSLIWGTAFVAQSAGSGMGAYSFLAGRSWLAVLVLLPTVKVFDLVRQRSTGTTGAPKAAPMQSPKLLPRRKSCWRQALCAAPFCLLLPLHSRSALPSIRPRQRPAS